MIKGAEGAAVAVDGGLGIVDLANGGKVVLARTAVGPGVLERELVDVLRHEDPILGVGPQRAQ